MGTQLMNQELHMTVFFFNRQYTHHIETTFNNVTGDREHY